MFAAVLVALVVGEFLFVTVPTVAAVGLAPCAAAGATLAGETARDS